MKVPEPRKLKSGTWFIQMRLGGESIPVSAPTRTECIKQAEKIKADYRNGQRLPCKSTQTLEQCVTAYIDAKRGVLSPSTIREYKSMSRNRFTAQMKKPVREITNWQTIVSAEAKNVKPKTLKNAWMMVAAALKFGGYDVPKVTLPQVPPNERQWLDPEQIKVFVADVANEPFAIPALLALHGLRRSEIMAVNWSDIDLTAKTIRVSGAVVIGEDQRPQQKASNKNRSSTRTIPIMIPELLAALEAVEDKSGPVVRCNPNTIYHQINRVCARNGLPQVGTHGLRHPYVKHTTKIFSLRLMDFQAQAYPDARRKTRGACQLLRVGQSRSPVRPLCNRKRFSCLPPQSKMSWILYAISMRLSGYTSTRSISSSASSVVSVSASKIALDASMRLSCRACSSCFCFACANTAA